MQAALQEQYGHSHKWNWWSSIQAINKLFSKLKEGFSRSLLIGKNVRMKWNKEYCNIMRWLKEQEHFYSLACQKFDEKIDATLVSVR